jgi:ABC-type multidrug transport system fused ATPase/permease subunit
MPWFDSQGAGALATRMSNDIVILQEALGEKNSILVQHVTTFLFGFILGFVKGYQFLQVNPPTKLRSGGN